MIIKFKYPVLDAVLPRVRAKYTEGRKGMNKTGLHARDKIERVRT